MKAVGEEKDFKEIPLLFHPLSSPDLLKKYKKSVGHVCDTDGFLCC